MNKTLIITFLISICFSCHSQTPENSRDKIDKAKKELTEPLNSFFSECLLQQDCNTCIEDLLSKANNEYDFYIVGGALFNIDADKSFELHKKAYELKKNELNFNLEYAMALHRKGNHEEAIPLYLTYKNEVKEDFRIDVWLAECYLNIGDKEKSIEHWKLANHPKNHTGIDKAIYTIHGRTDQIKLRSKLRNDVRSKIEKSAYELIFLDLNWEIDWWNTNIQEYFLEEDLKLIRETFKETSEIYKDLITYNKVKHFSNSDSIKTTLLNSKILIGNKRLIPNGQITSDILRIALINKLVSEQEFFETRKDEVIKLADSQKDGELLNIYAYLESVVNGHVSEKTDKKGWHEYKDERFAISYFIGLADKNRYSNPDLKQALIDFPNSAKIQWVKLNCALVEDLDYESDLIELIKKDFKTLGSDQSKYSYGLKSYYHILENGK